MWSSAQLRSDSTTTADHGTDKDDDDYDDDDFIDRTIILAMEVDRHTPGYTE